MRSSLHSRQIAPRLLLLSIANRLQASRATRSPSRASRRRLWLTLRCRTRLSSRPSPRLARRSTRARLTARPAALRCRPSKRANIASGRPTIQPTTIERSEERNERGGHNLATPTTSAARRMRITNQRFREQTSVFIDIYYTWAIPLFEDGGIQDSNAKKKEH